MASGRNLKILVNRKRLFGLSDPEAVRSSEWSPNFSFPDVIKIALSLGSKEITPSLCLSTTI